LAQAFSRQCPRQKRIGLVRQLRVAAPAELMGNVSCVSCTKKCSREAGRFINDACELDLEGAEYLKKGCFTKILGLDFDLTLTTERVYGMRDFDRLTSLFGGDERIGLLSFFLNRVRKAGCGVFIISWNNRKIISEALEGIGLMDFVECILDRRWVTQYGGFKMGKGRLMKAMLRRVGVSADDAVFVDDVLEILSHMPCWTHHVAEEQGMTPLDLSVVSELLQLGPECAPGGDDRVVQEGVCQSAQDLAIPDFATQIRIEALPLPYPRERSDALV